MVEDQNQDADSTMGNGPTGPDHADRSLCGGPRKGGRGPCGQPAGAGTPHLGIGRCKFHGGSTRSHVAAAQKIQMAAAVRSLGLRDDRPADEILLDELAWAAGHVAWLRGKVQELEPQRLTWGVTEEVHKTATEFSGVDTTSAAVPSIWWVLYREAQKHLLEVLKVIKGFDLDERRLEFARAQVAPQIAVVIDQFVRALGLTPEQAGRVPAALEAAVRSFLTGPKVIEGSAT